MRYLLDTSIIIDYFHEKAGSKELLLDLITHGMLSISLITYGELLYGANRAFSPSRERARIDDFVHDLAIEILPFTLQTIEYYANIKYILEKKGSKLDEFDLLIAAQALSQDLTLVTTNKKHFKRIPHIAIMS